MKTIIVPRAKASVPHREMRQAALRIFGLTVPEYIANTSQSPNEGMSPLGVHLASKTIDVNIYNICIRLNPHAPHLIQDHGSCNDTTRVAAEILQKCELLGCQIQNFAAARCLSSQQVQFQIKDAQAAHLYSRRIPLEQVAQPCKQFRQGKWLRQIIIPALFKPSYSIIHRTSRRKDQYRRADSKLTQSENQPDAILIRQPEVDNQGIVLSFDRKPLRCSAITRCFDTVPCLSQRAFEEPLYLEFIFNQQEFHQKMLMHCRADPSGSTHRNRPRK